MRIGGITEMSTVDWYGNVSLVLFFAGCNLRCPYCQNSPLIPLDSGHEVGLDYLKDYLETCMHPVPQLDSAVFTGGEPTLQPDAVIAAAHLTKEYNLDLMLDTNGTIFDAIKHVLETGLFKRVALDVKAPLNKRDYGFVTGRPELGDKFAENVKRTLKLCKELGLEVEARTTVAPGVSDDPEFILELARDIKGLTTVYYLQQFDNQGEVLDLELKKKERPSRDKLKELAKIAFGEGVNPVFIKTRFEGLERVKNG
ncbi:anaerobic ribonucleoside-triphosphate reductase activating protein [Candidatus Bathyarchaeota archaeon]|nr:anaerobic ribonucleoside-triphosphate reductase activating protein [Candidatus Bathyarchaeota archaeon]